MSYRTTTRDRSHLTILKGLKSFGFSVFDMASVGNSFPDILAANNRHTVILEVKETDGKFGICQLEFISTWKGYAGFATSLDEAKALVSDPEQNCLTAAQKDKIAGIALRYRAKTKAKYPQIAVSVFDGLMGERNIMKTETRLEIKLKGNLSEKEFTQIEDDLKPLIVQFGTEAVKAVTDYLIATVDEWRDEF